MLTDELASVLDLLALPIPEFVDACYHRLLGRHPDSSELKERSGALRAGMGRLRFLADISMSAEYRAQRKAFVHGQGESTFLEDIYLRYLGRDIDPHGMDGNLRLLAKGKTREQIIKKLVRSREARIARTFWFELDRLLADEHAEAHWFWRWPGRQRRRQRRDNRESELMLRQLATQSAHEADKTDIFAGSNLGQQPETIADLGPNARRILSRARQAVAGRA